MKSARERMEMVNASAELGSSRAAAARCGTTHKTVQRVVQRQRQGGAGRPRNTDGVADVIAERVRATDGRISAKRRLPLAQAAGYTGSARSFRRAVAAATAAWKQERRG